MNESEFARLDKLLPDMRKELVDSAFGKIPKSIVYLESAIGQAKSKDEKSLLYTFLIRECSSSRNHELRLHFMRKEVEDNPGEVLPLVSLAGYLAFYPESREEALVLSATAVALAKKQNRLVKYCLTSQARIALRLGEFRAFNDVLRQLIEDAPVSREEDYRLEFDFLDQASSDQIDHELVEQYRALMTQKSIGSDSIET